MFAELRKTSRVILLSNAGTVLLLFTRIPDSSNWHRWVTPGGGVDPGESHEQAAIRELAEETGYRVSSVGERVWHETIPLPYNEAIYPGAYQEFFLVRCEEEFEPDSTGWTDSEHTDVTNWRWFSAADLRATDEPFEPAALPDLIERLQSHKGV